jgi:hypothetical protein
MIEATRFLIENRKSDNRFSYFARQTSKVEKYDSPSLSHGVICSGTQVLFQPFATRAATPWRFKVCTFR